LSSIQNCQDFILKFEFSVFWLVYLMLSPVKLFEKFLTLWLPVLFLTALAGCSTTSEGTKTASNSNFTLPSLNPWARLNPKYSELAKGPLAGEIGLSLSKSAMKQAIEAEYKALEESRSGEITKWESSTTQNGKITPFPPYQVGASNCRRYVHSVSVEGKTHQATGTACRNKDGVWSPLT
jgi:surface antigen